MPEQPTAPELAALIGRPPEEIVEYFEAKGYAFSFRWRDVWQEAHASAFTVAGVMKMDALQAIRGEVEKSLSEGQTLREFKNNLEPKLRELGFWGEREVVDPDTGEVRKIDLSQPWRLRTIYRTNLQTSYMAGRWKSQQAARARRPYLRYKAILDAVTRQTHRAMHGTVLPVDDPFWDTHYPPNGWNCRCRVQSLSERQIERRDLDVRAGDELEPFAAEEWRYNPGEAAFQPDLEEYNYRVARPYVRGVLGGPKFEQMHERIEEQGAAGVRGETLPVAVLDDTYQTMFGAETRIVQLSDETLEKQIRKRPNIDLRDYTRVQDVIELAQLVVKDQDLHRVFVRRGDALFYAVVKVTGDRSELYLQSFRRTNADDVQRLRQQGQVIKDELNL